MPKEHQIKWDDKSRQQIEDAHASGVNISQTHLAPFLHELAQKNGYGRLELASALLNMAYYLLRKNKSPSETRIIFSLLADRARKFVDGIYPDNSH